MPTVVPDVSMSLDGFTVGPHIGEGDPNGCTSGWLAAGLTAVSTSASAGTWTRP
jgi:hypothetical protein